MTVARANGCVLVQHADTVHCARCGGVWDAGDDPGGGRSLCPRTLGDTSSRPVARRAAGWRVAVLETLITATLGVAFWVTVALFDGALRVSSCAGAAAAWCDRRWQRASDWARRPWGR